MGFTKLRKKHVTLSKFQFTFLQATVPNVAKTRNKSIPAVIRRADLVADF